MFKAALVLAFSLIVGSSTAITKENSLTMEEAHQQIARATALSDDLLEAFDANLDHIVENNIEGYELRTDLNYRKLLVIREFVEHKRHEIKIANQRGDSEIPATAGLEELFDQLPLGIAEEQTALREYKMINGNGFANNRWVLTFDDGPHNSNTRPIAQTLKNYGVKATFFWLSKNVNAYKAIAKEVFDAGHGIASHSVDHADLTKVNSAKLSNEVSGSISAIKATMKAQGASVSVRYFRAPYGAINSKVKGAIGASGATHVLWNVDSLDWKDKNSTSVVARVIKQMKAQKHGIILFHDIQPTTAQGTVSSLLNSDYVKNNKIKFSNL